MMTIKITAEEQVQYNNGLVRLIEETVEEIKSIETYLEKHPKHELAT